MDRLRQINLIGFHGQQFATVASEDGPGATGAQAGKSRILLSYRINA
jgi:hypothetical protein